MAKCLAQQLRQSNSPKSVAALQPWPLAPSLLRSHQNGIQPNEAISNHQAAGVEDRCSHTWPILRLGSLLRQMCCVLWCANPLKDPTTDAGCSQHGQQHANFACGTDKGPIGNMLPTWRAGNRLLPDHTAAALNVCAVSSSTIHAMRWQCVRSADQAGSILSATCSH